MLALPYYDSTGMFETAVLEQNVGVAYNRVPKGEVELRRSSPVLGVDGRYVGRVGGLIVDEDEEISEYVRSLEERGEQGHLWTRREVTVPMSAVEDVQTDAVRISLSEGELAALPVRRAHRWFAFRRS